MSKMTEMEILKIAEKNHNRGKSLYDGGYRTVGFGSKYSEGVLVFPVQLRGCNLGGLRSSGITVWEGWYVSDGTREIELIPVSFWIDGESYKEKKENHWIIKEFKCKKVVFVNGYGEERGFDVDF